MGKQRHRNAVRSEIVDRLTKIATSQVDPDIEKKMIPMGPWILGKMIPPQLASGLVLPAGQSTVPFKLVVLKLGEEVPKLRPDIRIGDCIVMDSMVPPIQIGKPWGYDTDDGTELFLYRCECVPAVIRQDIGTAGQVINVPDEAAIRDLGIGTDGVRRQY